MFSIVDPGQAVAFAERLLAPLTSADRVKRAERLIGYPLDDVDVRMDLWFALRTRGMDRALDHGDDQDMVRRRPVGLPSGGATSGSDGAGRPGRDKLIAEGDVEKALRA